MANKFNKRVFGAVVVKAVNSNYNADFTGQPRTLPNGTVYATDKAFKYTVRKYLNDFYPDKRVFFLRRDNEDFNPYTLEEAYKNMFGVDSKTKHEYAKDLLSCIDIRLFGATFAMKGKEGNVALSFHGPVQVTHGLNLWHENNIYTEQITSPFRNPNGESKEMTTIGRQTRLEEGHYVHHFSINPKNLEEVINTLNDDNVYLTDKDIELLKEAMRKGATYYDSTSKAGTENELLIWVELKENSKLVLPSFIDLIKILPEKKDGKVVFELDELSNELKDKEDIEKIEIFYNKASVKLNNIPDKTELKDIIA